MNIIRVIFKITNRIKQDNIFVYSAHASFYIIISAIPFSLILFSLAQFLFAVSKNDIFEFLLPLIPEALTPPLEGLINEIPQSVTSTIISFSAISLLWSASRGVAALRRGVRFIYHTPGGSRFFSDILWGVAYTLILIPLITALAGLSVWSALVFPLYTIMPVIRILIYISLFCIIYKAFSGKVFSFITHLPGAVFTTLIWTVFSRIYSFYLNNFANYRDIYGQLTALILLALWAYFCSVIFLLGAEVNMLTRKKDFLF